MSYNNFDIIQLSDLIEDPNGYWVAYDLCLECGFAIIEPIYLSWWSVGIGSSISAKIQSGMANVYASTGNFLCGRSSVGRYAWSC